AIGVTTCLGENAQFIAHSTIAPVWMGIIQSPISVNKSVSNIAGAVFRKQAVPRKIFLATLQFFTKPLGSVVAVMQMNFNFATAQTAKFRHLAHDLRVVLLDWIKKSVAWSDLVSVWKWLN